MLGIAAYHVMALLAFTPYLFSWSGVVVGVAGYYLFAMLGINLGYHRLLAHKGMSCPKWLERLLALFGVLCLQLGPAYWVAIHRRHHQSPDDPQDPHSPMSGFYWAHLGWILTHDPNTDPSLVTNRYAKDLMKDKFYAWLETGGWCLWVPVASWGVYFAAGFAVEWMGGGTIAENVRFGLSILAWGVFVRTVMVWHITWSVNSVCHIWGYRSHETPDRSRNNLLVGVLAHGEGWHNNHHAHPRSARHGHRWWELDTTWLAIRFLAWVGLVKDVQGSPEPATSTSRVAGKQSQGTAGLD